MYNGSTSINSGIELTGSGLNNLMLNLNSGTLRLSGNTTIGGMLTLNSGMMNTGSYNLSIASGGSVSGGSSSSYIITSNGGSLIVNVAANSSATYPVGTATHYAPATVSASSGSVSSNIGVMAMDSVYAQGSSGANLSSTQSVVDATWFLTSSATSGLDLSLQLMWSANMELNGFNRTDAYISHFTNGIWDANATASATTVNGMYAMSRSNITSLSPFTVADNNAQLNLGVKPVAANASSDLTVYPNPASGILYYNTTIKADHICIFDFAGRIVKTVEVNNNNNVPINELPSGCYNICFYGQGVQAVQKFVKE